MERKNLTQNADRYKSNDNGTWSVSASKDITPITITKGTPIEIHPLLKSDGIVVKVKDKYFASPTTIKNIADSNNPHYDIISNGSIKVKSKDVIIGKTIPIIELNTDNFGKMAEERDRVNAYAGVKLVDYVFETKEIVPGVPQGLIDQINYTLSEKENRPADGFEIYQLSLEADYSIEKLKIQTSQEDGSLDKNKLDEFIKGSAQRIAALTRDFNMIKELFYLGKAPASVVSVPYSKVAQTSNPDEETQRSSSNVVFKQVKAIGTEDTTTQKTQDALKDKVDEALELAKNPPKPTTTPTEDALIAKWKGYNFTDSEKGIAKTQAKAGTTIFPQTIFDKIGVMTTPYIGGSLTLNYIIASNGDAKGRQKIDEQYRKIYGTGKKSKEYNSLNTEKKAEFVKLSKTISELELKNNVTY